MACQFCHVSPCCALDVWRQRPAASDRRRLAGQSLECVVCGLVPQAVSRHAALAPGQPEPGQHVVEAPQVLLQV
jgi:hypothetical protein